LSETCSISTKRRYGWFRVCRVWRIPRSTAYDWKVRRQQVSEALRRRGRRPAMTEEALVTAIREVLTGEAGGSFHGEGYRKVWARLRHRGLYADKERIRRVMGEHDLLAPTRMGKPRGPRTHDGSIIPMAPNVMWGTDATAAWTLRQGQVTVFATVDHFSGECLGIHAAKYGTRHEALEPIRQAIRGVYGRYDAEVACGVLLRHDHGSQYVSRDFQRELEFLGIESSPSFVRSPEGNGVIERFFRTLKEQLLWLQDFEDEEALRNALYVFRDRYNANWIIQRHGYRTPSQVRDEWNGKLKMAS
jgi:putative transposase